MDGTPFALVVPYLFEEHFQSRDDYSYRPYYGSFIRLLKYFAFFALHFSAGRLCRHHLLQSRDAAGQPAV